jgi:hypothetical protein
MVAQAVITPLGGHSHSLDAHASRILQVEAQGRLGPVRLFRARPKRDIC